LKPTAACTPVRIGGPQGGAIAASPFAIANIRLFIAFRIFFNARFYYPVFTILFLDFGLSLAQFALLNVVWALTIVLLEVPSGALADTIGRKNLLVGSGVLMVVEMAILCFAPLGSPNLLFALFVVNRILSGTAEAAASGADEAIAYDSLKKEGNVKDWGKVLEFQMRAQSLAFIGVMSLGAAVYDPLVVQKIAAWLGLPVQLSQQVTLRFPLYLTLIMAFGALFTVLRIKEAPLRSETCTNGTAACGQSIYQAFQVTLGAGRWLLKSPLALVIILAGLLFDHIVRMIVTLNSQYYRLIEIPEALFGLIASGMALLGFFLPRIARWLAENRTPAVNLAILSLVTLCGLAGVTFFWPVWGLLPMVLLRTAMLFTAFFVSHYLNRVTSSEQRATVLSFKGLAFNLGYGLIGLMYAGLLAVLRSGNDSAAALMPHDGGEAAIFRDAMHFFPPYFLMGLLLLYGFAWWRLRRGGGHREIG
jgi:MFS family permease